MTAFLRALILFDACTFIIWASSFIWFLSVDASVGYFDAYRQNHTSLLVHAITTWQMLWLLDDFIRTRGKRVRWQSRVRCVIFAFTLILDVFMLVETIRFITRADEVAWGLQVAISTLFSASSLLAFVFVGIKHL